MKPLNIVVTGETNNIKTLIQCISYGPEETVTHSYQPKDTDTSIKVAMSFGSLQVDEDHRIDFFGGTDKQLFQFVSELPSSGTKGMIIVLDADQPADIDQLDQTIKQHINYLNRYAMVVGITGDDYLTIKQAEERVRQILVTSGWVVPVFSIDTQNKEDVGLLVETLLCFTDPGVQENHQKPQFKNRR